MTERSMPLEGVFITYSFQEKRAHQAMEGKAPGFVRRWKEWQEGMSQSLYSVPQEGRSKEG